MQGISLTSTMGPGLRLDVAKAQANVGGAEMDRDQKRHLSQRLRKVLKPLPALSFLITQV